MNVQNNFLRRKWFESDSDINGINGINYREAGIEKDDKKISRVLRDRIKSSPDITSKFEGHQEDDWSIKRFPRMGWTEGKGIKLFRFCPDYLSNREHETYFLFELNSDSVLFGLEIEICEKGGKDINEHYDILRFKEKLDDQSFFKKIKNTADDGSFLSIKLDGDERVFENDYEVSDILNPIRDISYKDLKSGKGNYLGRVLIGESLKRDQALSIDGDKFVKKIIDCYEGLSDIFATVTPKSASDDGNNNPDSDSYLLNTKNAELIGSALQTKRFLIFPGISGTGKTQIARSVSKQIITTGNISELNENEEDENGIEWGWFEESKDVQNDKRKAFLPVRPNWNESSQIWGNFNPLTGKFQATDALKVLLDAYLWYASGKWDEDNEYPSHFIILDEMNLARVEYYFSDVLSLMESGLKRKKVNEEDEWYEVQDGEKAEIHQMGGIIALSNTDKEFIDRDQNGSAQGVPEARLKEDQEHHDVFSYLLDEDPSGNSDIESFELKGVPSHIAWPPNLGIIGTVNVDETTHSFAPKVLDRAHVVEFNDVNYGKFLNTFDDQLDERDRFEDHLRILEAILRPANLHFGYRTVEEMIDYANGNPVSDDETWDQLVSSKVLPKIHGRQDRISDQLKALLMYTKDQDVFFAEEDDADESEEEEPLSWSSIKDKIKDESPDDPDFNDFDLEQSGRKVFEMYNRMTDTGHASFF